MSQFTFEDLLCYAGGDGASATIPAPSFAPDLDALYHAWSIERGYSIECEFLLSQSRAMIAQLLEAQLSQMSGEWVASATLIEQIDSHLQRSSPDQP